MRIKLLVFVLTAFSGLFFLSINASAEEPIVNETSVAPESLSGLKINPYPEPIPEDNLICQVPVWSLRKATWYFTEFWSVYSYAQNLEALRNRDIGELYEARALAAKAEADAKKLRAELTQTRFFLAGASLAGIAAIGLLAYLEINR